MDLTMIAERAAILQAFTKSSDKRLQGYAHAYRAAIRNGQCPDEAWEDNMEGAGQ